MDYASRAAYGKSLGEVRPADALAAILSMMSVGRFAPAARGAVGTISAGAQAARSADFGDLARSVRSLLIDPLLPTHVPPAGRYRFGVVPTGDLALYGKRPVLRASGLPALMEHLIQTALAAVRSPENAPPGSVNPAAMP